MGRAVSHSPMVGGKPTRLPTRHPTTYSPRALALLSTRAPASRRVDGDNNALAQVFTFDTRSRRWRLTMEKAARAAPVKELAPPQ